MKAIIIIPRMGGGGAERVVSLLANSLSEDNNDITVLTLVGGESFYQLSRKVHYKSVGVTVNRKNFVTTLLSKIVFFPKALFSIFSTLKNEKYDVVVSMLTESDILVACCKLLGAKFKHVCSERNDPTQRSRIMLAVLHTIYRKSDLFVCQGKAVYDFYKEVPAEIKRIIPNPVDGSKLPERALCELNRVVAVGRLNKQKNFPLLINSFAEIHDEYPHYMLDIYGEGPERTALEKLIEQLNMQSFITLRGAQKNVQTIISDAELFVMSSDYEGFPNALLEAMAIGLPVISTDFSTGIARELISEENGIVVPPNDQTALSSAMRKLLSDKTLRADMGTSNRKKCEKYYVENIVEMWKKELKGILS